MIWPQKAQKQNFRDSNFNVLQGTKIEIQTFYESINIGRSMLDVRCLQSASGGFDVQSFHCSGQAESHTKFHTSAAAGLNSGQFNRERNFGFVSQIDVFILVFKSEYRIMNIECRISKEGILSIFIN